MIATVDYHYIIHLISEWSWIPFLLVNIFVIVSVLIENRNPPKSFAWIMVIVFLPIVGIILYFFFGQNFKREKYFNRINKQYLDVFSEKRKSLSSISEANLAQIEAQIDYLAPVYQYLYSSNFSYPTVNNTVELLINGENKFPKFLEALRSAKHHIHLEYYIFEEDTIGNQVIDILTEKARSGVQVRVIVDNIGSPKLSRHGQRLLKAGVDFQVFLPVTFTSLANSNFRNHQKILIVDAKIAFVGGINISDKYINKEDNKALYWRDTSVMLKGTSINLLQMQFWISWMMTDGKPFPIEDPHYQHEANGEKIGKSFVSFAMTRPGLDVQTAVESLTLAIILAKKRVQICTPYFIPTDSFKSALMIAASKGVEIELIIPKENDSLVVKYASISFLKPLIKRGIKVYMYEKGFIHAKTLTVDDRLAFVGTVNLDMRSFLINLEINAVLHDETLLKQMHDNFILDKENSSYLSLEELDHQSIFLKMFSSICRLLAPLL